jgi:hypothetical protein
LIAVRYGRGFACALAVLIVAGPAAAQTAPMRQAAVAVPATPAAMAQYQRALAEYQEAHDAYAAEADAYWSLITQKRVSGSPSVPANNRLRSRIMC